MNFGDTHPGLNTNLLPSGQKFHRIFSYPQNKLQEILTSTLTLQMEAEVQRGEFIDPKFPGH